MFKFDDEGSTYLSLPPNLQDVDNECFGYAFDRQIKRLHCLARKLTVWSSLNEVDAKYFDYMALCIKAPYYRSEYPEDMKRELIKKTMEMHRYAGTRKAVDKLLEIIFDKAEFIPWNEYGGEPYHFKPVVYDALTEDAADVFARVVKKVKAARSIMDAIELRRIASQGIMEGITAIAMDRPAAIGESIKYEMKKISEKIANGIAGCSHGRNPPIWEKEEYKRSTIRGENKWGAGAIGMHKNNMIEEDC